MPICIQSPIGTQGMRVGRDQDTHTLFQKLKLGWTSGDPNQSQSQERAHDSSDKLIIKEKNQDQQTSFGTELGVGKETCLGGCKAMHTGTGVNQGIGEEGLSPEAV